MLHRGVSVSSYSSLSLVVKEIGNVKGVSKSRAKPYVCNECDKTFTTQRRLKVHKCIIVYDDDDDLYACPICSQQFNTIGKLVVHTKAHITARSRNLEQPNNHLHGGNDSKSETIPVAEGKPNGHEGLSSPEMSIGLKSLNAEVKSYDCDLCHKHFSTYQSLKRHKRVPNCFEKNPDIKRYTTRGKPEEHGKINDLKSEITSKVDTCNEQDGSAWSENLLDSHGGADEAPPLCDICGRGFINISGLRRHITRTHGNESTKNLGADSDLKSEAILSTRLRHKSEKSNNIHVKSYKCDDCSKCFTSRYLLKVHVINFHTKERGKSVDGANDVKSRMVTSPQGKRRSSEASSKMNSHNTDVAPYKCEYCSKYFARKQCLYVHRLNLHKKQMITSPQGKRKCSEKPSNTISQNTHVTPYKCDDCNKYFACKQNLKDHDNRIHPKEQVKCVRGADDMKSQKISSARGKHKKDEKTLADAKLYKCNNCAKCYRSSAGLEAHDKTCNVCKICGKTFSRRHKLTEHLNSHDGRFKCKQCNVLLSSNYSLKRHSLVHTGELPFRCQYCSAGFRASDKLQCHMRSMHRGKRH